MRLFLVIESARLFGVEGDLPMQVAALEAVHCYSLVHDDLPAMDDDDMRRGKPTVHKAYDDATAILAGRCVADTRLHDPRRAKNRKKFCQAGRAGRGTRAKVLALTEWSVARCWISRRKGVSSYRAHGARPSVPVPSAAAFLKPARSSRLRSAPEPSSRPGPARWRKALRIYGAELGLAFQIRDDLLDVEGEAGIVGKRRQGCRCRKGDLCGLLGIEGARAS